MRTLALGFSLDLLMYTFRSLLLKDTVAGAALALSQSVTSFEAVSGKVRTRRCAG